jgi:hypothetical protein
MDASLVPDLDLGYKSIEHERATSLGKMYNKLSRNSQCEVLRSGLELCTGSFLDLRSKDRTTAVLLNSNWFLSSDLNDLNDTPSPQPNSADG